MDLAELHAAIAVSVGSTPNRIKPTRGTIQRNRRRENVYILQVDDPTVRLDAAAALAIFAEWAAMDRGRDYLRLDCPPDGTVAAWDRTNHDCWWFERKAADTEPVTLEEPNPAEPTWAVESNRLLEAARMADRVVA